MTAPGSPYLVALTTHARAVPVEARERFRAVLAERGSPRAVTVATCHRVEAYLEPGDGADDLAAVLPERGRRLEDAEAARHAMRLAVGLDSTILGEDQVLHQLREAVESARAQGRMGASVERLFRIALREGRRTRSWRRTPAASLADVALERAEQRLGGLQGRRVLVVGTGEMGTLLARAASRLGATVAVSGRHARRAAQTAAATGMAAYRPDGGLAQGAFEAILVALGGPWQLQREALDAVARSRPFVVDLSAPPAVASELRDLLGDRFVSIDALAEASPQEIDEKLRGRLEAAADAATSEFLAWVASRESLTAIRAIAAHVEGERIAELEHLWRRLPQLGEHERRAIEGMSRHLADRLLREPLARLGDDTDGRRAAAARDLFGL